PQLAVLGLLALGVYALAGVVAHATRDVKGAAVDGGALLVGVACGLLLCAPLLIPATELKRASARGKATAAGLAAGRLRPGALLGLFFPRVLGGPYERPVTIQADAEHPDADHAARVFAARMLVGDDASGASIAVINNPSELSLYPGAAVLLLAVV